MAPLRWFCMIQLYEQFVLDVPVLELVVITLGLAAAFAQGSLLLPELGEQAVQAGGNLFHVGHDQADDSGGNQDACGDFQD